MNGSDGILERNLAVLRKRGQGDLANALAALPVSERVQASIARSGDPTLKVNGQNIHSPYDPKREAAALAEKLLGGIDPAKPVLFVGGGCGYVLEQGKDCLQNTQIVLAEPVPEVLAAAIRSRDMSEIFSLANLAFGDSIPSLADNIRSLLGDRAEQAQVVVLPSARSSAPREVDALLSALSTKTGNADLGNLRILLVGPVYGGSLPVTRYVHSALKKLGHTVEWLDFSPLHESVRFFDGITRKQEHRKALQGQYTHLMAQTVLARAELFQPQIVFFMAQSPGAPNVLEELRNAGIPTAFWFVEDGKLFDYGMKMAPYYDVFFHIQGASFTEQLKQAGARHVHYLPLAADPDVHKPLQLTDDEQAEYGSDISHVGAGYPNRRRFFPSLLDFNFKLWGSDWEQPGPLGKVLQRGGERISTEDTVKIFNASKVNLNLHSSTFTDGVNPDGDFVNPRTFELAACGAFQLVDERSLLPSLFSVDSEMVTFLGVWDCREKIAHYLEHPEEAKAIADAARNRVLQQHTYAHRMQEALSVIAAACPIPENRVMRNTVASLVAQAGKNRELAEIFGQMGQPEDELTLSEIADTIRHGQGKMNESEALLLLMDEFHTWAKEKGVA